MSIPIEQLAHIWLSQDRDPESRATIQGLLDAANTAELEKRLRHRMEFGTAGLRSAMDAGYAFMNSLTILQTSQGFAKYVIEQNASTPANQLNGIVIGYDGRRNSAKFARLTANVFLHAGFQKVYLFRDVCPTPYVPFAVRKLNLNAGVMVTASHNPKDDNGYKVYWATGAQIISPHDSGIARCIEESLDVAASQWDFGSEDAILAKTIDPTEEVTSDFFESMKPLMASRSSGSATSSSSGKSTPVVYTAMHGVGTPFSLKAMKQIAGMTNVIIVPEQCYPDPYFRTVDFPNPEEGKSSLNLAIRAAEASKADIIVANDPDADRFAAAERIVISSESNSDSDSNGGWKIFSGNELGAIFGWWLYKKATEFDKKDPSTLAFVSSTVSSSILRSIAKKASLYFEETLTGFKFMGTRAQEIESTTGKEVIFAFEEAIGFMCGSRVRDKDGVTAAAVFCDMIQHHKSLDASWTIQKQLGDIYKQYGLHLSLNSYVISKDPKMTGAMFDAWRNNGKYTEVVGGSKVVAVRDLVTGYDSTREDKKAVLPLSTVSPMITCELENGVRFTVRASGTEPKVKFYTEIVSCPESGKTREELSKTLEATVDAIISEIMKPAQFGFAKRAT